MRAKALGLERKESRKEQGDHNYFRGKQRRVKAEESAG